MFFDLLGAEGVTDVGLFAFDLEAHFAQGVDGGGEDARVFAANDFRGSASNLP